MTLPHDIRRPVWAMSAADMHARGRAHAMSLIVDCHATHAWGASPGVFGSNSIHDTHGRLRAVHVGWWLLPARAANRVHAASQGGQS